jgi:PTH2 family peptidyl-tRNA hydrolase
MGLKQVIVIRSDLNMGRGKIAAQSAHASVAVLEKVSTAAFNEWVSSGMKKVVLKVGSEKELLELFMRAKVKFPTALVKDAGLTQIAPGSATSLAIGPAGEAGLDLLTGHLKLL